MGDENKRGSRVLRFAVTGALLAAPLATACGGDDDHVYVNEPAPEPVPNEPVQDGPQVPDTPPTVNNPPEPQPTVNEPAPDPEPADEPSE
ncbi:MAG: hypothetical protein M5U28_36605 [Sandaracinaceae bacterium]|nr:hypothetical protein [Sandaracinaceae bacterium]